MESLWTYNNLKDWVEQTVLILLIGSKVGTIKTDERKKRTYKKAENNIVQNARCTGTEPC